jgi:hypothetical protein
MGRIFRALQKAEKEYQEKYRQVAIESENKFNRLKITNISLLALLLLLLIFAVYLFFQGRPKVVAFDYGELKSAKTRIAELENVVAIRDQMLSQSEENIKALQSKLDEEKKSKKGLVVLSSKDTVVAELQERLKISQSDHLSLKNEIAKSKRQIEELKTQVVKFEKEKAYAEAPMVVQMKKSQQKATSAVILQNDAEPGDSEAKADTVSHTSEKKDAFMTIPLKEEAIQEMQEPSQNLGISASNSEEVELTRSPESRAISESEAVREEAKSPDPTAVIDWLLKKHSK